MSVQEILAKETKRWKYKDCQEVIASSEATPEQKSTAQERMNSIKQWLDSQKTDGSTIRKATPTEKAEFTPTAVKTIDTTKIDLHASEMEVIRKETHEIVQVILTQAAQVHVDCSAVGYDNPAFEGLVLKEVRERLARKNE